MTTLSIRPRSTADIAGVARLLEGTHRSDGYPVMLLADMEAWAAGDQVIEAWVAVDPAADDEVVGHVALTAAGDDEAARQWVTATRLRPDQLAVVRRLVVARRVHGAGTGAALLQLAVSAAHGLGRRPVLDMADNLTAAGRLYERAGFTRIGAYDLELTEHLGAEVTDVTGAPDGADGVDTEGGGVRIHRLHVLTWVGPEGHANDGGGSPPLAR